MDHRHHYESDPMLNSILNGDLSNSVLGRQNSRRDALVSLVFSQTVANGNSKIKIRQWNSQQSTEEESKKRRLNLERSTADTKKRSPVHCLSLCLSKQSRLQSDSVAVTVVKSLTTASLWLFLVNLLLFFFFFSFLRSIVEQIDVRQLLLDHTVGSSCFRNFKHHMQIWNLIRSQLIQSSSCQ